MGDIIGRTINAGGEKVIQKNNDENQTGNKPLSILSEKLIHIMIFPLSGKNLFRLRDATFNYTSGKISYFIATSSTFISSR